MAVEISKVTHDGPAPAWMPNPHDDLITAAWLDSPSTGPVDGYRFGFEASGWVVSKAPVAEVEFVHEGSVVACCELSVTRPDIAKGYGSSPQVGFWRPIGTVGLAPDFTIKVRVVFQDGRRRQIAEIRGTQLLTSAGARSQDPQSLDCAPRLILAGHSHLRAIARRGIEPESLKLVAGPRGDGTHIMVGPWPKRDMSYWDTLADLAMGADVGILWNGNEHNALYFFEAETPFDFLSAHVRKINPSAQIKPKAAIRHRFQEISFYGLGLVLQRLVFGGLNRIALIGTPPPNGDNEALRALLRHPDSVQTEEFFVNWAAQLGQSLETIPITDPYVRLKLWYLVQDMLAEEARTRGLMFIPVPKEVQDADGFLKREFWHDMTHANEAYGDVMYETVLRAFR